MNYKEKAITFWNWFETQEKSFITNIKNQQYTTVNDTLKQRLQELLPDVVFEISHAKNRFIVEFMPMGNALNRVMMLSLIYYRPKTLKNWEFYNYRTAKKGIMKYQDLTIDGHDILIIPVYDKKQNRFKLKVKADMLQTLPDEEKFRLCYALLYEYLGEILCESLVEQVEFIRDLSYKFRYKKQEQVSLYDLRDWICTQVGAHNVAQVEQQGLVYETFSGKPKPLSKLPRYDIVSGYSAFIDLCHEYYEVEQPITNYIKEQGIQPVYIYIESSDQKQLQQVLLDIQKALLQHGIMVGVSEALGGMYVDVLWLDQEEFLEPIKKAYEDINITLYEF